MAHTSWPRASNREISSVPIYPVDPLTKTRIALACYPAIRCYSHFRFFSSSGLALFAESFLSTNCQFDRDHILRGKRAILLVFFMRLLAILLACSFVAFTAEVTPLPRFASAERRKQLMTALPEVDRIFEQYAGKSNLPGLVWGVVIDGEVVHVKAIGMQDRNLKTPVTAGTVFRIASMTKSFTALAILKLRDEDKLSLEDPVSRWIPEFARMPLPTNDTPPIRIRQLLTHGAGFPEDNPWGDQQLGVSEGELTQWLDKGLPFSTAPDTTYEYSNYGFALLGRIVAKCSGVPYREYLERNILAPLGMNASTLEPSTVSPKLVANGYRRLPDGAFEEEKSLPHGAFGSMGGLLTSATDLGKYVAFQLSAWPPRDEQETGPVRRSSVREMNQMWRPSLLTASAGNSERPMRAEVSGYGYGLRISRDCRFQHVVGHGGGLPGFGSYMSWLPEYGIGIFAMANLTYAGPAAPIGQSWDAFLRTGALKKRELPASPLLTRTRDSIGKLWNHWDDTEAKRIAAMNLFLDAPIAQRRARIAAIQTEVGRCSSLSPVAPENWLRGAFRMACERGFVDVTFTLAPTQPPQLQHLSFARTLTGEQEAKAATQNLLPSRATIKTCGE